MPIDRDALVAFTQQLVRMPSVHDPATGRSEDAAAHLVAEQMRAFGWVPELDEVAPGRPNVIAIVDGGLPGPDPAVRGPHRRGHRGRRRALDASTRSAPRSSTAASTAAARPT